MASESCYILGLLAPNRYILIVFLRLDTKHLIWSRGYKNIRGKFGGRKKLPAWPNVTPMGIRPAKLADIFDLGGL